MIRGFYDFSQWPSWFPKPLSPEHTKRLQGWARTLPSTFHKPWSREDPVIKRGRPFKVKL